VLTFCAPEVGIFLTVRPPPSKEAWMPTVTVERSVTPEEAVAALKDKLGDRYEVSTHGSGSEEGGKVKQSAASTATVRLDLGENATTFHVHGGGLVISRMVNEFGIAKKVAAAIQEAFPDTPASPAT
jgi:hypothetical protein